MSRCFQVLIAMVLTLCQAQEALCAHIKVTSPAAGVLSSGSTTVTFNVTWNASWRSSSGVGNWDAAWAFVKFRTTTGGTLGDWKHASLNDSGHTMPSGAAYSVGYVDTSAAFNISTNPGVGVFIYRSSDSASDTFTANNVSLSWNYSQDGVANIDTVEVRVFAIEMVYIPTGSFFAGDTGSSTAAFKQGSADNDPWYIGSESSISVNSQAGTGTGFGETNSEYYYVGGGAVQEDVTGASFTIPAAFPKGYQKFFMMKGEVSQGQWVSFFNTLNATQKATRDITSNLNGGKNTDAVVYRNNVNWAGFGDAMLPDQGGGATYEAVAMNYVGWADLTAYLDWAGLRPMSELEYERAGRGPYRALAGEFAWGSTAITGATVINNAGKDSESAESGANCVWNNAVGVQGPMRVGAMSYNHSTRLDSGAGYYGNMDLTGNLYERTVTVGNSAGRLFNGSRHGNGTLDSSGDSDVSSWPSADAVGSGNRGGAWNAATSVSTLSARGGASFTYPARFFRYGIRGVRVAP